MTAWSSNHQHHHLSHLWRVSALVDAFLELVWLLCTFLCAIIFMTTIRLLKSSGLFFFQTCLLSDVCHHHNYRQGKDEYDGNGKGNPKLDPTPMSAICEDCTLCLSNLESKVKRGYVVDKAASGSGRCRCNVASVNGTNPLGCGADHIVWDDYSCRKRCGDSCASFEDVVGSSDGTSEHILFDSTTNITAYGCECRQCVGIADHFRRSALKRKFAKVFCNDSRGDRSSSCRDRPNRGSGDTAPLITSEKGPAGENQECADGGLLLMHMDGSSCSFLSDASDDHQCPARFSPAYSVRNSSQESFSYSKRHFAPKLTMCGTRPEISKNRGKLSIDTDLLACESSAEWCGSSASPAAVAGKEMKEGGSRVDEDDLEIRVMELREALREEQEAIAALYLELEEERNAASSAAHEAMAMISRVQHEKAAIQMEARQYQRMAEEKVQYDQESMVMLQEILVQKDKEVYALEEELNLCRKRLLTLCVDGLMEHSGGGTDRVGSSAKGGRDVLLIERETLFLEGSEYRRDRRDERLLAEIKHWLHEANEKAAPEELNVPGNVQKTCGNINRLLPSNGKKNLLESFSSVAVEDSQRDDTVSEEFKARLGGIVNDELETENDTRNEVFEMRTGATVSSNPTTPKKSNEESGTLNETAAGYESFQGMMESLRQQPRLRDAESLKTLNKIEEKFHRQSTKGEVRTGDELRQIWKNILKSFESDEIKDTEVRGGAEVDVRKQSHMIAVVPADTGDNPGQNEVGNAADTDRSIGEKRLSVLEYVSKFEEQLHQLDNKKPPHGGKLALSIVESVAEASPESKGASAGMLDSEKYIKTSLTVERPIPPRTRLRKLLSADVREGVPNGERNRFSVRGEASPSSESATRSQDARFEKSPVFEEERNHDGSSFVHDIYEVQVDTRELLTEMFFKRRKDTPVSHDIKQYVSSSVNDLVLGQFVDSHETARCVKHNLLENRRPKFTAGHTLEGDEANGKGRPHENSSGNFSLFVREEPNDLWPGDCLDTSREPDKAAMKSPSSLVLNSDRTFLQDVVQQLTRRLKALETDRQLMQDTIASLERENGEMKHLQDIAQQPRELQGMEQTGVTNKETGPSDDATFVSSIKGMLSMDCLRRSVQSQFTKLAQIFRVNGDPGDYQGDQQAGLFRLLHRSPLSKQQKPIERANSLKAVYAVKDAQSQPFTSTLDTLLSHRHSWPMDAKDRSETAFDGWDY